MSKPVLFTSVRPLNRAENMQALYAAYDGEKTFVQMDEGSLLHPELTSDRYDLLVSDEVPAATPGKCIFIGHGISGGKTYGLDQPIAYMTEKTCSALTYAICTDEKMVGLTARQFRISPKKVLPLGMPRTDQYIGKKKGDGGTMFTKKRVYLYAPTFRGGLELPDPVIDWKTIDDLLTSDEVMLFKDHMIPGDRFHGNYKHIYQLSKDIPSAPYLIDCDVLVTDFSSILFDAHLLHKPVVLFAKDREHYLENRGMYLEYPYGYAGRFTDNEERLVKIMREAKRETGPDKDCRLNTSRACDGHSTERIIKLIKEVNGNA